MTWVYLILAGVGLSGSLIYLARRRSTRGASRAKGGLYRLTPRTEALAARLFQPNDQRAAKLLLRGEPFHMGSTDYNVERLCFAAMKLSNGSMAELRKAVDLARADYRDLLMHSGFGYDIHAHEAWARGVENGGPADSP